MAQCIWGVRLLHSSLWDIAHSYKRHKSSIWEAWLIFNYSAPTLRRAGSSCRLPTYEIEHIPIWDMTHLYVRHNSIFFFFKSVPILRRGIPFCKLPCTSLLWFLLQALRYIYTYIYTYISIYVYTYMYIYIYTHI